MSAFIASLTSCHSPTDFSWLYSIKSSIILLIQYCFDNSLVDMPLTCSLQSGFFLSQMMSHHLCLNIKFFFKATVFHINLVPLEKTPPTILFYISALTFDRPSAGADLLLLKCFLIYSKYFISILNFFGNVSYF